MGRGLDEEALINDVSGRSAAPHGSRGKVTKVGETREATDRRRQLMVGSEEDELDSVDFGHRRSIESAFELSRARRPSSTRFADEEWMLAA